MASLAEVYENAGGAPPRRLYLGTALFVLGASMVVAGIAIATTDVLAPLGATVLEAREVAGVLAGLGTPAVFVGVFAVLPAAPRERAVAAIGASLAVLGVVLFWHAYPDRWYGATPDLALPVVTVYFLGAITTFWSMFAAVVNVRTRNDPGGTITLERVVDGGAGSAEAPPPRRETAGAERALGGVGVVGNVDRDEVMRPTTDAADGDPATPASDGGTHAGRRRAPDEGRPVSTPTDRYCGNCRHFDYVRDDGSLRPYCGFHDEAMDDMDPCWRWRPNA